MYPRPKILFVTPVLGHPAKGGPELRIENSIKALARIATVTLYSRKPLSLIGGLEAYDFLRRFVEDIHFAPFCRQSPYFDPARIRRWLMNRFFGHAPSGKESESDFQDVIDTARNAGADVIWLGYGNISYPLLTYIKAHSTVPVVVDTDSVWSRYILRGCPFAKDEAERRWIDGEGKAKEDEELRGTRLADVTTAVSAVDAQYYRTLTDDHSRVQIFSNVIDLDSYDHTPPPEGFVRPSLYLAGTFWPGSPMEDAARWLLELVLPDVKRSVPDIHLYIVGRGSTTVLADISDNAVTVAGELDSVLPYLSNATVAVVPLRFESGTRFKILEAGACGIPVVSTTLGAEGIPVLNGQDVLIADTPEEFSLAVIRVINDRQLAETLGANLKKLVSAGYSLDVLACEGENIVSYLRNSRNHAGTHR